MWTERQGPPAKRECKYVFSPFFWHGNGGMCIRHCVCVIAMASGYSNYASSSRVHHGCEYKHSTAGQTDTIRNVSHAHPMNHVPQMKQWGGHQWSLPVIITTPLLLRLTATTAIITKPIKDNQLCFCFLSFNTTEKKTGMIICVRLLLTALSVYTNFNIRRRSFVGKIILFTGVVDANCCLLLQVDAVYTITIGRVEENGELEQRKRI